ncbi:MAG TPA: 50S ribosomal protein L33 [Candidatus Azoamicus sp. OHIO1]
MAKKSKSIIVKLVSMESNHYYTTTKNVKMLGGPNKDGKLNGLMKYDPIVRRHVKYIEKKIGK